MGSSNSKTGPCPGSGVDRKAVGGIDGRGRSRPGKLSSVFCGCSSSSSRNPPAEGGGVLIERLAVVVTYPFFNEIVISFDGDIQSLSQNAWSGVSPDCSRSRAGCEALRKTKVFPFDIRVDGNPFDSAVAFKKRTHGRKMGHPPPEHSDNSLELSRLTVAKTEKPQEYIPGESNSEFSASEIKDSSESSDDNHEETLDDITMVEDELDIGGSHVLVGRDNVSASLATDDDYCREKTCSTSGTSFLDQQYSGSALVNTTSNEDVVAGLSSTEIHGASQNTLEVAFDSVVSPEVLGDGHPHILSRVIEAIDGRSSGSGTVSPDSSALYLDSDEVHADVSPSEELPSGLELLWSGREQSQQTDGVVQVDIVAVSTDLPSVTSSDTSSWESRRRDRRMFWDVISRHGSRGQGDSSTIIFATEDSNYLESHDRWPFDSSDDISDDWAEERSFRSRFRRSQRRRRPRSEIWDRLRFGLEASSSRNTSCPSGLHPDGLCSCDRLLSSEESSTRTSISRIVMLAEALFEVLDELHRQPIFPTLSPVSLPAPGSVVDSFPLKSHQKKSVAVNEETDEQCYICLVEYADGDQIRVLPCKHEYHMHCVDKWLKEIHRICPLCRGDVCEGSTEHNTASDPEISAA